MTVGTYLTTTAANAVLSSTEKSSIATSVSSLKSKIDSHFGSQVSEHFTFGSFTRGTILPRKLDEHSDIDYMVVFKDATLKPQTYLTRLKNFVEAKYAKSEIKTSHPTVVLELSHIKFELVPALSTWSGFNIPAPASGWQEWMPTTPNTFNDRLTEANKRHNDFIKPMVRLLKYWNARNGYLYSSFLLEQELVTKAFNEPSLKYYVYDAFEGLSLPWDASQTNKDKVDRAKGIIRSVREYERVGREASAETEIKKLLPEV